MNTAFDGKNSRLEHRLSGKLGTTGWPHVRSSVMGRLANHAGITKRGARELMGIRSENTMKLASDT